MEEGGEENHISRERGRHSHAKTSERPPETRFSPGRLVIISLRRSQILDRLRKVGSVTRGTRSVPREMSQLLELHRNRRCASWIFPSHI
jgi:hypothetical protein